MEEKKKGGNAPYAGPERRRFKRMRVGFIVIYRPHQAPKLFMSIGGKEVDAIMLDLSEGGMSFVTDYDIAVSTPLSMRFTMINPYAAGDSKTSIIEAEGEIRNSTHMERTDHRLGISFTRIDEKDKLAIANFVATASGGPR